MSFDQDFDDIEEEEIQENDEYEDGMTVQDDDTFQTERGEENGALEEDESSQVDSNEPTAMSTVKTKKIHFGSFKTMGMYSNTLNLWISDLWVCV